MGLFSGSIPPWFVLSNNLSTTNTRAIWLCSGAFLSPPAPPPSALLTAGHYPLVPRPTPHAPRHTPHDRQGPPSIPRAELDTALPSRRRVNMLRNATFSGFWQKFGELSFRRKLIFNMSLRLFLSSLTWDA